MKSLEIIIRAEKELQQQFEILQEIACLNQAKVLDAFRNHRVRDNMFFPSTGYGYGDSGRDVLEAIVAQVFKAEDSIVRPQVVSGTHAIAACLFALLKPGDEMITVTGRPYDTLAGIIGVDHPGSGTLRDRGIRYREIALLDSGEPDWQSLHNHVQPGTKIVFIQRSRGYSLRPALSVENIERVSRTVKSIAPLSIIVVDNCYGEFTENQEPVECGVDLIAGSLIKNPGGGLAPAGGYIAGRQSLIEEVAFHLTAPGLGKELGAGLIDRRWFYQGLFMAPHVVLQALKGALLLAMTFSQMGYQTMPEWDKPRSDIVQAVRFDSADELKKFCQTVQKYSPLDSDVTLEFAQLPGYADPVIMAAGTFVQGSSIELSCDAPLREPFCAFMQGGLTYEHCRYVVGKLLEEMCFNK